MKRKTRKIIGVLVILGLSQVFPKLSLAAEQSATSASVKELANLRKRVDFKRDLKVGDKGEDVLSLERFLNENTSYFPGQPNKDFDSETQAGLGLWQLANNLPQTGVLDADSRKKLVFQLADSLCPKMDPNVLEAPLVVLDKNRQLPEGFKTPRLMNISLAVPTSGMICVASSAFDPLVKMFTAADKDGVSLSITSGYRDVVTQKSIFDYYKKVEGLVAVLRHVATPGHSEHHLGTALDINFKLDNNHKKNGYVWLEQRATEFGFVMSYPKGKEQVTGYKYEPWHYRYVGVEVASKVKESGLTLAQYLGSLEQLAMSGKPSVLSSSITSPNTK